MKFKDDVIIIGSGLGSLSCASYLAKNGYKVKIFEKLNQSGGVVNTFKRGNYWFEATTHQVGGFNNSFYLKNILKNLNINIPFIKLSNSFESLIFDNNYNITKRYLIKSGKNNSYKSFKKYFPLERKNIKKIINITDKISNESLEIRDLRYNNEFYKFFKFIKYILINKTKKDSFLNKIGNNFFLNYNLYKNTSFKELISFINNDDLKFLFSLYCYYFLIQTPRNLSSILISNYLSNLIYNPPLFIKGGTKTLLNKLLEIFLKYSGEINFNNEIDKIIINDKKAVGVKLKNNKEFYAKYIITNTNAFHTYNNLIDKNYLDKEIASKLSKYKPSKSSFQLFLGLPFDLKEFGYEASTCFFSNTNDINKLYDNDKDLKSRGFLITNYTLMDPDFSPKGKSSLMITEFEDNYDYWKSLNNNKYIIEKKIKQDIILDKLEKIMKVPFKKAEIRFSSTAKTIEFYSGKTKGGVYGIERNMSKDNKYENKSFIDNLYLTGSDTSNSGSISGVVDSGFVTANLILKNK